MSFDESVGGTEYLAWSTPTYYTECDRLIEEPAYAFLKRYLVAAARQNSAIHEFLADRETGETSTALLLPDYLYDEAAEFSGPMMPPSRGWRGDEIDPPPPHAVDISVECTFCKAPPGAVCVTASGRRAAWAHTNRRRNSGYRG